MAEKRQFMGISTRAELKAANNLGVTLRSIGAGQKRLRKPELDRLDAYYEGRQYDGKVPWDFKTATDGDHIPIRERKPRIILNFAKVLTSRLSGKLLGKENFPTFQIEDDPDTQEYLRIIIQSSRLRSHLIEPLRRSMVAGSVFVRFAVVNGQWKLSHFLAKWCFPKFDSNGNLEEMEVKYVFDDEEDRDDKNNPKKKWFRMTLGKFKDVLYDNPIFNNDTDPAFKVASKADHNLGFVQGEWIKTSEQPNSVDGPSMIDDILGFIDELNYSMSQSSTAVQYNQDPQLVLKGLDEEGMENLIRSSMKAWNLGREGDAQFLEAGMSGVEAALELRDKVRLSIQDISRVVLLDPEKMVGHAQSAKAMEVLHGPMVELIDEMRPQLEKHLMNLVLKMAITNMMLDSRGAPAPVPIPPGFKPKSLNISVSWPPIFAMTMQDLQAKVSIATSVAGGNIISRETMTKWLAKDFGVENIEEEIQKVADQPVINPFGAF